MHQTTQEKDNAPSAKLYLAFELSKKNWVLGFSDGTKLRRRTIDARDREALVKEIARAKERFGLPEDCPTLSCYEAGMDGFWIHRMLVSDGIDNIIVDPGSIEGSNRRRQAKTDRIDVAKLVRKLVVHHLGHDKVWSVVNVPDEEIEDGRRRNRELKRLKTERTSLSNRGWALLMCEGICDVRVAKRDFLEVLERLRRWDGRHLPENMERELRRLQARIALLQEQIKELETARKQDFEERKTKTARMGAMLVLLRGIADNAAATLSYEFFGWRNFRNGKEVGSLAGLTGTPYDTGESEREQGISKVGNWRVRTLMIEIAWGWLRWQPKSELSKWFEKKFGEGKRHRRVGIVALARRLLIALWRYVEDGVVPPGAVMTVVK